MVGKVKKFSHEYLLPIAFHIAEDDSCVHRDPKTLLIGEGADAEEVEAYVFNLMRWNGKCMYQEVTRCARREIPATYFYANKDMTVPLDYQVSMVKGMEAEGIQVRTVELVTGYCPNLTMIKELMDAVNSAVAD